jgi:hypothetical protein
MICSCLQKYNKLNKSHLVGQLLNSKALFLLNAALAIPVLHFNLQYTNTSKTRWVINTLLLQMFNIIKYEPPPTYKNGFLQRLYATYVRARLSGMVTVVTRTQLTIALNVINAKMDGGWQTVYYPGNSRFQRRHLWRLGRYPVTQRIARCLVKNLFAEPPISCIILI